MDLVGRTGATPELPDKIVIELDREDGEMLVDVLAHAAFGLSEAAEGQRERDGAASDIPSGLPDSNEYGYLSAMIGGWFGMNTIRRRNILHETIQAEVEARHERWANDIAQKFRRFLEEEYPGSATDGS